MLLAHVAAVIYDSSSIKSGQISITRSKWQLQMSHSGMSKAALKQYAARLASDYERARSGSEQLGEKTGAPKQKTEEPKDQGGEEQPSESTKR